MIYLLHDLITQSALTTPDAVALVSGKQRISYGDLDEETGRFAAGLNALGLARQDRVAIYLEKSPRLVVGIFGTARSGAIFVPINPVLKAAQAKHILQDSGARVLVTSADRLAVLEPILSECDDLRHIVLSDDKVDAERKDKSYSIHDWQDVTASGIVPGFSTIDADVAGILYTSGSTGRPKGVVLSHRNFVVGAQSVSSYIGNVQSDKILAALPLSFDAGFSQLTTAFNVGASVVLHEFMFPADIVKVAEREQITGMTAVPPLWAQIADQEWSDAAAASVRYFANTGGKMPRRLLDKLREKFPNAAPFLMYGLTEAFRSTYLPPEEVDRRPDSIGKAIPNAEILVVREDGTECGPDEPGELVHRGALVAHGYWNAPEKTRARYRPNPLKDERVPREELVVFSGDIVKKDEDGFLYFVGRVDDMIKTSGYRVSPTEIEEAGFESGLVKEIAALGVEDERLGQKIVVVCAAVAGGEEDTEAVLGQYRTVLPTFMVPSEVQWRHALPRSANGKIDRPVLAEELRHQQPGGRK